MCFNRLCFIQATIQSPPAMCSTCVRECSHVVLALHPRLCRFHAHHCGHNAGIIAEVEYTEIDVGLRSHTFRAANYEYMELRNNKSLYVGYALTRYFASGSPAALRILASCPA